MMILFYPHINWDGLLTEQKVLMIGLLISITGILLGLLLWFSRDIYEDYFYNRKVITAMAYTGLILTYISSLAIVVFLVMIAISLFV